MFEPNFLRRATAASAVVLALGLFAATSAATSAVAQDEGAAEETLSPMLRTMSVNSMLELDVVTADDESLGTVYDLVADPTDGLLKFLVVERTEGILGIFRDADTRVAVPWHRVSIEEGVRQFVIDMTVEEFEAMPTWEGERTEAGGVGAAPIDERPDQDTLVAD